MGWLIILAVMVLGIFLYTRSNAGFGPSTVAGATNALLAEQLLRSLAQAARNPLSTKLRPYVIEVYRNAGFPNQTEESIASSFNESNRLEQLNILAMAADRAGLKPSLPGEHWLSISNPFTVFPPNATGADLVVTQVMERLVSKHNIGLEISVNQKFRMDQAGIWDGAS
jgi:hypothetical protein